MGLHLDVILSGGTLVAVLVNILIGGYRFGRLTQAVDDLREWVNRLQTDLHQHLVKNG